MEEQAQGTRLYVGNLDYAVRDEELAKIFSDIEGVNVVEAKVIMERDSHDRSRGFGFVTVETAEMAEKAIEAYNGKEVGGRELVVNIARPKRDR